jgi:hypothetical protein
MNTVLWVIQVILSIKFLSVAFTHGFRRGQPLMQQGIQRMGPSTPSILSATAGVMFVGSIGLLLPAISRLPTWTAPAAAAVLAISMLVSIVLHLKCREKPVLIANIVLFVLSAFVAYGRWEIAPL